MDSAERRNYRQRHEYIGGGGGEGGGAEDCQISTKEHDGDIISNVGRCRREWDGGEKEVCVGGCIGSRKV